MEKFHVRLKRLRQQKGLSMREVALLIHVPETTYREWEYGRAIQGEPYLAITKVLGISLSELLVGEDPSRSNLREWLEQIQNSVARLRNHLS